MVYQVNIFQEPLMCQSLEILSQINIWSLGDGKTMMEGIISVPRSPEPKALTFSQTWEAETEEKADRLAPESY